jgi:phage/plasmid-like protein (TIGR03299 family)
VSSEIESAWMGGGVAAWWDRQKEFVQAELMEPEEAWEKGGINWRVNLYPCYTVIDETEVLEIPEQAVIRDKDNKRVATVGPDYNPLQNWELMEMLMAVTEAGYGLKIESAMSLKEGRVVAICARRPEPVRIADDDHLQYVTGANWHDGTRQAVVYGSNVRTVCANTLAFGMASAPNIFKFRHVGSMEAKIEEAKRVLEMSFVYQDRMVEVGNKMALTKMTDAAFTQFLKKAQPLRDDDDKATMTRVINTREGIKRVYNDSDDLQNLRGTTWGALQATAEFFDHSINFRSPDNRFIASITGHGGDVERAFKVLDKQYQLTK